jgi:hypothetical protein
MDLSTLAALLPAKALLDPLVPAVLLDLPRYVLPPAAKWILVGIVLMTELAQQM